jgi:hypothetical protein
MTTTMYMSMEATIYFESEIRIRRGSKGRYERTTFPAESTAMQDIV